MHESEFVRLSGEPRDAVGGRGDGSDLTVRLVDAAMRLRRSALPPPGGFVAAATDAPSWAVVTVAKPGGTPLVVARPSAVGDARAASARQAIRRLESELRVRGLSGAAPLVTPDGRLVGAMGRAGQASIGPDIEHVLTWILDRDDNARRSTFDNDPAPTWIRTALGITGSSVWWMASPGDIVECTADGWHDSGRPSSSSQGPFDADEVVYSVARSPREPVRATTETTSTTTGSTATSKRHAVALFDDRGMRGILVLLQPMVQARPLPAAAAAERLGELVDRLDRIVRPAATELPLRQRVEQWSRSVASPVLTAREIEIVTMLVQGYRTPSIARTSYISPHTVRNHLKSIYAKLGLRSQSAVVDAFHAHRLAVGGLGANDLGANDLAVDDLGADDLAVDGWALAPGMKRSS